MSTHLGSSSDAPIDLTLSRPRRPSAIPSGAIIINLDADSDEEEEPTAVLSQMASPAAPMSALRQPVNATPHSGLRRSDISLLLNPVPSDVSRPACESSTAAPQPEVLNRPNAHNLHHIATTSTPTTSFAPHFFTTNRAGLPAPMQPYSAAPIHASPIRTGMASFGESEVRTQTTTTTSPSLASQGPASRPEKTTTSPYAPPAPRRDLPGSSRPAAPPAAEPTNTIYGTLGNMRPPAKTMGASMSTTQGEGVSKPRSTLHITKQSIHVARKSAPSSGMTPRSAFRSPIAKEKSRESAASPSHSRTSSKQIPHVTSKEVRKPDLAAKESVTVEDESAQGAQTMQADEMPLVDIDISNLKASASVVEDILNKHIDELRVTHSLNVKHALSRHRLCYDRDIQEKKKKGALSEDFVPTIPEKFLQKESPFADMKPMQTTVKAASKAANLHLVQEVLTSSGKTSNKSYMSVPIARYRSDAPEVPYFHEYVTLRENVLTENNRVLMYWPYFQEDLLDDLQDKGLWTELEHRFIMANEERPRQVLQDAMCRLHRPYVERFFEEISVTWKDVLFWLLAPETDITQIIQAANPSAEAEFDRLLLARDVHCKEDFNRQKPRWKAVFLTLPVPSIRNLRVAALACTAFLHLVGMSLWHLARRSEAARSPTPWQAAAPDAQVPNCDRQDTANEGEGEPSWEFRDTACRVCHVHDCFFHGEIRGPDSDNDVVISEETSTESQRSGSESTSVPARSDGSSEANDENEEHEHATEPNVKAIDESTDQPTEEPSKQPTKEPSKKLTEVETMDIDEPEGEVSDTDVEKPINYKKTLSFNPRDREAYDPSYELQPMEKYDAPFWNSSSVTHMLHERRPFYPCNHEGSCERAQCRCFRERIMCEKSCGCDSACKRRWPGCDCARNPRYGTCSRNSSCGCRTLNRECDPKLCGSCGAAEVLDPVNRYNDEIKKGNCCNVHIQLNLPKKTFLCHSEVHGFGLQVGEQVKAHEYLGEYKGEIVTNAESTRRGTIYAHLKTNYLFTLNSEQEVDSTRAGNKFRFINNSDKANIINCYPVVTLCNGVTRIGMFASRELKPGTELYFNYGYPKDITKHFWEKGQKPKNRPPVKRGKVVPVKTKRGAKYSSTAKVAASKSKRKTRGKNKNIARSVRSIEERRAQTAKARESRLYQQRAKKKGSRNRSSSFSTAPPTPAKARASNRNIHTHIEEAEESPESQSELLESQESFPPPEIADSEVEEYAQDASQSQADSFIEPDADEEDEDEEYAPEVEEPEQEEEPDADGRLSTIAESDSSNSVVLESLNSQDGAEGSRLRNSMGMRLRARKTTRIFFPENSKGTSTVSNWSDGGGATAKKRKRGAAQDEDVGRIRKRLAWQDEEEAHRGWKRPSVLEEEDGNKTRKGPVVVGEEQRVARKRARPVIEEEEQMVTRKRARRIVHDDEDE